ncbi:MAG: transketolase family protein [Candidatus Omnitrophica bacterium]|nr:transketolase family protein [Candidatus Omnitrophota bacterium]
MVNVREKKLGQATRDAYGDVLVELGRENPDIVVLDADLSKSTKTAAFGKAFPDRFFNCGIQEANMVGIAAGLSYCGKISFVSSFACFLTCKGYDQLRMSVAFPSANVKVVTSHGGISVGEDGVSQQSIEDFALMTALPNFYVIVPADGFSAKALIRQAACHKGPVYVRCGRPKTPVIYDNGVRLQMGKGSILEEGKDVGIIACGLLVYEALQAAQILLVKGIRASVVDMHTIKPLDTDLIENLARKTGALVTCEEHSMYGGLSATVSQAAARIHPVPIETVAIKDTFAESGAPEELFEHYGLTAKHIVEAALKAVQRK